MTTEESLLETLRSSGALKTGIFSFLPAGTATATWRSSISCGGRTRRPRPARSSPTRFGTRSIDVVVGPTTGGVILAFEVAQAAGSRRGVRGTSGRLRHGPRVSARDDVRRLARRVLVVDDILTTGGSVRETLQALAGHLCRGRCGGRAGRSKQRRFGARSAVGFPREVGDPELGAGCLPALRAGHAADETWHHAWAAGEM